jgi:putative Mn2+ efflux pump MntP
MAAKLSATIILCIFTSTDNFSVGASYAISRQAFSLESNAVISLMNATVTLTTMLIGSYISDNVDQNITSSLGAAIFFILGFLELYSFIKASYFEKSIVNGKLNDNNSTDKTELLNPLIENSSIISNKNDESTMSSDVKIPVKANSDDVIDLTLSDNTELNNKVQTISRETTLVIGSGLCFTNIGGGLAAGLAKLSIILTTAGMFIVSFIMMLQWFGFKFDSIISERYLKLVSGLALLVVGVLDLPFF